MAYYVNRNGGAGNRPPMEDKSEIKSAVKVESFYKDEKKKIIDPDLFDSTALRIAESFVGKGIDGKDIGITSTQLRKIFDEVKRYERIIKDDDDGKSWNEQYPFIKMIKSKVSYLVARASTKNGKQTKEAPVYKNLKIFLDSAIDNINDEKDYHIFVSLFEAAYGFYYEKAPKDYLK